MNEITTTEAHGLIRMTLAGFSSLPVGLTPDTNRDAARSRLTAWGAAISSTPALLDSASVQVALEADLSTALDLLTRAQWRALEQATGQPTGRTHHGSPVVVLEQRTA